MKISLSRKEVETAIREKYGEGAVTINEDGTAEVDTEAGKKRLGFRDADPLLTEDEQF